MQPTHLIVHEHELTLKGRNRPWFVDKLKHGVRLAFRGLPVGEPIEHGGRLIVPITSWTHALEYESKARVAAARLFGAAYVMAAVEAEADIETIAKASVSSLR